MNIGCSGFSICPIKPGQCTGVVGRNGVGKTTLLRVCSGQLAPSEGAATLGNRVRINYIDQTRMVLEGAGSLLDEVSDGGEKLHFGDQVLGARAYFGGSCSPTSGSTNASTCSPANAPA